MNEQSFLSRVTRVLPIALVAITLTLSGCPKQGTAEKAGENIDEAVDNVRDGAEEMGEDMGDAMEDAGDEVEDALD